MRKYTFLFFLLISFKIYSQTDNLTQFRGIWISTVKMLDYPSARGLSSDKLKSEYLQILDSCKAVGINAIVFQIRPAADAFYNSPYEPWSEWLTGKQGRAPNPYFDPLEFMIKEAHKRNMQFHAWINPFRAVATISKADIVPNHITKTNPNWFFDYDVNRYFDPGIPEVQDYLIKIITDIVRRYDIDGIHFDDYFYPYPVRNDNNNIIDIPDQKTFIRYGNGIKDIKDWRRDNINRFVQRTHDSIKSIKPDIRFGISPPGVWRNLGYDPDGSATLGLAAYDWIYADVLKWLKNNWVDYVAPQLYWYIGHKRANYSILVDWWDKHNYGVDLYIGLNIHGIDQTRKDIHWGNPSQVPDQIKMANSYSSVKGFILYRYKSLSKNPLGIKDSLRNNYFADTMPVILIAKVDSAFSLKDTTLISAVDTTAVVIPEVLKPPSIPQNVAKYKIDDEITILWDTPQDIDAIQYFAVYKLGKDETEQPDSSNLFLTSKDNYIRFDANTNFLVWGKKVKFVVTSVGKNDLESEPGHPVYIRIND